MFPTAATITNLLVSRQPGQPARLIVVTDDEIRAVPLSRCGAGRVGHCSACVRLRDPYCAWDELERRCRPLADWPAGVEPLQNVTGGYHPRCPRGERAVAAAGDSWRLVTARGDCWRRRGVWLVSRIGPGSAQALRGCLDRSYGAVCMALHALWAPRTADVTVFCCPLRPWRRRWRLASFSGHRQTID